MTTPDPYDVLEGMSTEEAIRSNTTGAPNEYPYRDVTALPLHERDLPMNSDAFGPSQAELNPAFYPKKEDGGPVTADGEGIGTEPNADDKALAAAANADPSGEQGLVEQVQESIDEGTKAQMDVDEVNAKGEARAPEGTELGGTLGKASGPGADTAEPSKSDKPKS